MFQTWITPKDMEDAAYSIDIKREEIVSSVVEVKKIIDSVVGDWDGSYQSAFIASFDDLYDPTLLRSLPEILSGISMQFRAAAEVMRTVDDESRGRDMLM